ncbi:MAG: DUF6491 family protein [Pseudomonadales bacterium]
MKPSRLIPALLVAGLLVVGCASAPADREASERRQETVADILNQPLDAEEYGTPRRCMSEIALRDFEPLGDRYLVFEGSRGTLWLNELKGRCPGLDRGRTLAFRNQSFQVCEFDQFLVSDWFVWSRYRRWPWNWTDGIPCTLGKFQPVSGDQVDALRAALR